ASGDITPAAGANSSAGVAWMEARNGSYLQTPLAYGGQIYASTNQGIFKAYDARTGRKLYEQRLGAGGAFTSSPISADGKVYVTTEDGEPFVIKAGAGFEVIAKNPLGEIVLSTPAISDGTLYIRTTGNVLAIAE